MLHLQHIHTSSASNGITALEKLKQDDSIDVVISDFHMPYMDGLEVIRRTREELKLSEDDLKIILLHSSSDDKSINRACKKYDVFSKSISRLPSTGFTIPFLKSRMANLKLPLATTSAP